MNNWISSGETHKSYLSKPRKLRSMRLMSLGVYKCRVRKATWVLVNPVPVSDKYLELVKTAAKKRR